MAVSLVSAPVLGFDLVRHPAGSTLAGILLDALGLGPPDLALYTPDRARARRREGAWHTVHSIVDARGPGSLTGSVLAASPEPRTGFAAIADSLIRSMIVDLDDLERLIRSDILLWTGTDGGPRATLRAVPRGDDLPDSELVRCAADALIDAVASLWIDGLDRRTADVLSEPHQLVQTQLPARIPDVGPCSAAVGSFLTKVGALDADGRRRLRTVGELMRPIGSDWAAAVHEAAWAAMTTGRIRAAASAQLLGVKAFQAAGFTATDGAEGLWNTISGHIQAEVLSDVLAEKSYDYLTRTWSAALAIG